MANRVRAARKAQTKQLSMGEQEQPTTGQSAAPIVPLVPHPVTFALPERVEKLECVDIYTGHYVKAVTNAPDYKILGRPLLDVLAESIREWTFRAPPPEGSPEGTNGPIVPPSADAIMSLPPDLHNWLINEWQARRALPLALRVSKTSADSSPPPTDSNGHSPQTPT